MITSIYSLTRTALKDRKVSVQPTMLVRMMASVGGHILNLANLDSDPPLHPSGSGRENFRNHIVFISPSGFGKSVTFRSMLKPVDGVIGNCRTFKTDIRSTFSKESWLGTAVKEKDGSMAATDGVFSRFKRGILGADEYQPLKMIFNGEGLGHDEIYLMTGLDTDSATKDLSYKNIEINGIGMTLWAGMRPTPIMLTSGLARRFSFELFFPSRLLASNYKKMARSCQFSCIDPHQLQEMSDKVDETHQSILNAGKVALDYSEVDGFLNKHDMPHFEENIFRRLSVGLSVAMGYYPDIIMTPELEALFCSEIENREALKNDIYSQIVRCILRDEPGFEMDLTEIVTFLSKYYQMNRSEVKSMLSFAKLNGTIEYVDKIPRGKNVRLVEGGRTVV